MIPATQPHSSSTAARRRSTRPIAWTCLHALLLACEPAETPGVSSVATNGAVEFATLHVPERLPSLDAGRGPWARPCAAPLPPTVLACVDGVAVERAAFDRARADTPAEIDNRALLQALIRAEVLAAEAIRRGLFGPWLLEPYRSALMRRQLNQRFRVDFGPKDVRQADINRAWLRGPIRVRYAHETHYSTIDAQFLCCTGDWHGCEVDPKVQRCAADLYPKAEALAAELAAAPPASDDEFEGRVMAARPRFTEVSVQRVGFFYNKSKPYDQQGDYDKMLEPWTLAAVALQPGQISPPVRSAYGWHIIRLGEIAPRLEGKPTDQAVRDDIAKGVIDGVRERDLQIYLIEKMKERQVVLHYEALGE